MVSLSTYYAMSELCKDIVESSVYIRQEFVLSVVIRLRAYIIKNSLSREI